MNRTFFAALALACTAALGANPVVELKTSMGSMTVELYPDKAPKTTENFLRYVRDGFYDGTVFHRVIDGFMIQGGGLDKDMREKATRAPIENEARNGLKNEAFTIAMARKPDPHSASAQFFINLKRNEFLDYPSRDGWGYAVFGRVTKGFDVVQAIARTPKTRVGPYDDVPATPIVIESATILSK